MSFYIEEARKLESKDQQRKLKEAERKKIAAEKKAEKERKLLEKLKLKYESEQ